MTSTFAWQQKRKTNVATKRKVKRAKRRLTKEDTADWKRIQGKIKRAKTVEPIQRALRLVASALQSTQLAVRDFIHGKG